MITLLSHFSVRCFLLGKHFNEPFLKLCANSAKYKQLSHRIRLTKISNEQVSNIYKFVNRFSNSKYECRLRIYDSQWHAHHFIHFDESMSYKQFMTRRWRLFYWINYTTSVIFVFFFLPLNWKSLVLSFVNKPN